MNNPGRRFLYRLAGELKYASVGRMLREMSSLELSEWIVIKKLESKGSQVKQPVQTAEQQMNILKVFAAQHNAALEARNNG